MLWLLLGGSRRRRRQRSLGRSRCGLDGKDALRGQRGRHGRRVHARRQAVAAVKLARDASVLILEGKRLEGLCPFPVDAPPLRPADPAYLFWPRPRQRAHRALLVARVHLHVVANHLDGDFLG